MAETTFSQQRSTSPRGHQADLSATGTADILEDLTDYLKAYAREKPDVAALWCFGIGFVLGWKLKPW